jgi:hypothetical protein
MRRITPVIGHQNISERQTVDLTAGCLLGSTVLVESDRPSGGPVPLEKKMVVVEETGLGRRHQVVAAVRRMGVVWVAVAARAAVVAVAAWVGIHKVAMVRLVTEDAKSKDKQEHGRLAL